jgi:hypothetical protein
MTAALFGADEIRLTKDERYDLFDLQTKVNLLSQKLNAANAELTAAAQKIRDKHNCKDCVFSEDLWKLEPKPQETKK